MSNPNPLNQFEPGQSGNPNGRPKKGETITDIVRQTLRKEVNTKNGKKKLKELFSQKVINMALKGDLQAIKLIWNYDSGMPKSNLDINDKEDIIVRIIRESVNGKTD